jgi:chitinase
MPISRCWSRFLVICAAAVAVTGCDATRPDGNAQEAELNQPWFGGYLDVTLVPSHRLQHSPAHGTVTTVLSFIGSDPAKPCEPSWDGFYDLDQANDALDLDAQVDSFREAGNDIAVSFGGQLGTELAVACTDSDALVWAYAAVITRYGLDVVDLDLEGAGLADLAAAKRRAAAIARLQAERPPATPLKVWLTLPVSTDGLTPDAETSVETMLEAGVELAGVNIMTMNFGPLAPGQTMLQAAIGAAEGTHRRLAVLYEETGKPLDAATVWNKIGLTPMIGTNDVKGQVFTLEDADGLNSFALERGIGRMSMWSLNRDTGCDSSNQGQLGNGVSNNCSGVTQEPGRFAELLGNGYAG